MSRVFDEERLSSLTFRLQSEDLIRSSMGLGQLLIGWHRWGRNLGLNPFTGRAVVVDSLWIITYGARGLFGLLSLFLLILSGPITVVKKIKQKNTLCLESVLLSLVVILFAFDCLSNAMVNTIYLLCTGALVSYGEFSFKKEEPFTEIITNSIIK
jgi:hypothetical protein